MSSNIENTVNTTPPDIRPEPYTVEFSDALLGKRVCIVGRPVLMTVRNGFDPVLMTPRYSKIAVEAALDDNAVAIFENNRVISVTHDNVAIQANGNESFSPHLAGVVGYTFRVSGIQSITEMPPIQ